VKTKHLFFFVILFILAMETLTSSGFCAERYPDRPIQLVIPMPPGGFMDIIGRWVAEDLERTLSTKVIVMNKTGASMTLGTDSVVRSKKDGYTILFTNTSAVVYARVTNPDAVPYDPIKDLEPLGLHLFFPLAVAVHQSSPWKSYVELVDYAKKNPQKIRVCTTGQGSIDHFNLELTQTLTGAQFTHVPFKGASQIVTGLTGGHVEATYTAFNVVTSHVDSGTVRILLLSKKMPGFTDVPTLSELGYKQDLLSAWFAWYAPAGVPEEVTRVLVPAIEKAIKNPELKAKIEKIGCIVDYKPPVELKKLMVEDYERASAIAAKIGLRK
jgi:tripartite-type tricarboxylate transporter receptor subunit TctC